MKSPGSSGPVRAVGLVADLGDMLRVLARSLLRFVYGTDQIAFTCLVIADSRHLPRIAEPSYRAGKEPMVAAFAKIVAELTDRELPGCEQPGMAARQFMGLIQEFVIWPHVMGVGAGVVDAAVAMFRARYGIERRA